MKIAISLLFISSLIYAQENSKLQQHIQEQMAKEKQYAKEKAFYHGKDYNLTATQIDKDSIDSVPIIKPEDDFDMTDVYRDDI